MMEPVVYFYLSLSVVKKKRWNSIYSHDKKLVAKHRDAGKAQHLGKIFKREDFAA